MIKGSCLCNKIQFEISGEIKDIIYCHCSQCRKAQGSAFATNANVDIDSFKFITGEDQLSGYEYGVGRTKYFCKNCGSPVISKNKADPKHVRIRLGLIETNITERPIGHTFVASKANWESIEGDLPQFEENKV